MPKDLEPSAQTLPQPSPDRLLILPEVAELLACSPGLVRRMTARGQLPRVKLGRLVRYRASDVARVVAVGAPRAA